ncbi:MAG TPA: hypothetical protein VFY99_08000 [Solirubrobacterales bacterium]
MSRFGNGARSSARGRRPGAAARDLGRARESSPRRPRLRGPDPGLSLARLAAAVREHEELSGGAAVPKRPADHELYRRLAAIERIHR